jgi:transposase
MDLTDEQWALIEPLIPHPTPKRADRPGRPRRDNRPILNGILWILRTGAQWKHLPRNYPPYQTCHRRFQEWVRTGVMATMLRELARDLQERGGIDLEECFIDGTFVAAKKGGPASGRRSAARAQRSWRSETAMVFLSPFAWTALRRTK